MIGINDYIGYSGGFILSICLIPQIVKVIKTNSADDISYCWQFLYIIGLLLHIAYAYFEKILPILIPNTLELCLCILLTIYKIRLDILKKRKPITLGRN